ncbi:MAG: hypothetical protein KBT09_02695 [Bacteroidales bacterium]|nr:hypothetical protein [Candidatus Sodaliphilus fimicaballi]
MKKILVAIIAIVATSMAINTVAQSKLAIRKVDFNHVKEVTENPNNMYYYPKLLRSS